MYQEIKDVSEVIQTVTPEEFSKRVEIETDLDKYPITSKEMLAVIRNRYRKLKRFYNVLAA
jgi:hypothetical protein